MKVTMTRPRLRGAAVAAVALAAIAVAGCGGSSSPSASAGTPSSSASMSPSSSAAAHQQVTIEGTSTLRFSPMTVHLHAGAVAITLKDMGAYPHNIVIPGLHVTSRTVSGDPGGMQVTFTVTFPHPGHYPFHCQYHASAGMTGTFVVS